MKERKLPGASGAIHKLARARHALRTRSLTLHLLIKHTGKPTISWEDREYFTVGVIQGISDVSEADELQRLNGVVQ